jgi:hypothetical protein
MARLKRSEFRFRKHDKVGTEGAEEDQEFLSDCFYDRGDLKILSDTTRPECIVLGRTGSGKSALLIKFDEEVQNVFRLEPESLSLQYLSNSIILRYLNDLGVNLNLFYKLLWRHVFAVELIRAKFVMNTESDKQSFLQRMSDLIRGNRPKEKAIKYLTEWGESFWQDTEYRIREVTSKLESDVNASLGAKAGPCPWVGRQARRSSAVRGASISFGAIRCSQLRFGIV